VTVEADNYLTDTTEVVIAEDGQRLTRDVALHTGIATAEPEAVTITVPAGFQATGTVGLTNSGTADLSWSGFAWEATAQEEPAILVYSSLPSPRGETDVDLALQRLGLDYTSFREDRPCTVFDGHPPGDGMEKFGEALAGGDWDPVIVDVVCSVVGFSPSTAAALEAHVAEGGRLILQTWQFHHEGSADLIRPLADVPGVRGHGMLHMCRTARRIPAPGRRLPRLLVGQQRRVVHQTVDRARVHRRGTPAPRPDRRRPSTGRSHAHAQRGTREPGRRQRRSHARSANSSPPPLSRNLTRMPGPTGPTSTARASRTP
jgi:hypothetical protein